MLVFGFCYNNNLLDVYFYVSMRVLVVVGGGGCYYYVYA